MLAPADLLAFAASSLILAALPGPDLLYVLAVAAGQGARRGVVAALGFASGVIVHAALVAVGLAELLATKPIALFVLRMSGALYLLWCGLTTVRARPSDANGEAPATSTPRLFGRAILANILNPKVLLFFLSYLPQFVHVERGTVALQVFELGFVFQLAAASVFSAVALTAGMLTRRWRLADVRVVNWISGVLLIILGALLVANTIT